MKPGCFVKSVIVLTIIVAVAIYLIKYKLSDYFGKTGKQIIGEYIIDDLETEFNTIKASPEKDSLKIFLEDYVKKSQSLDSLPENIDTLVTKLQRAFEDSIIERKELFEIQALLNTGNNHERSKKN
ncbi:MAG: hypothetical protein HXY49_01315 [Ignavibacteriaceae bacterium]|nr:hypothetical protein [Ignavibacteriaceae bacterium]